MGGDTPHQMGAAVAPKNLFGGSKFTSPAQGRFKKKSLSSHADQGYHLVGGQARYHVIPQVSDFVP